MSNPSRVCGFCGLGYTPEPRYASTSKYCSDRCKKGSQAKQHLETKRKWLVFQREVWGTTELGRREVEHSKRSGRLGEKLALTQHLPALGFTDIDDFSGHSNQFFTDFIATYKNKRVLVDATIKLKAYIPEKVRLADSLRMDLYIIHVSPKGNLFYLNKLPRGQVVCRVPAQFIRQQVL